MLKYTKISTGKLKRLKPTVISISDLVDESKSLYRISKVQFLEFFPKSAEQKQFYHCNFIVLSCS